jgi:putative ATPase
VQGANKRRNVFMKFLLHIAVVISSERRRKCLILLKHEAFVNFGTRKKYQASSGQGHVIKARQRSRGNTRRVSLAPGPRVSPYKEIHHQPNSHQTCFECCRMVDCPICGKGVKPKDINNHIDSGCESYLDTGSPPVAQLQHGTASQKPAASQKPSLSTFFSTPTAKRPAAYPTPKVESNPSLSFQPKAQNSGTNTSLGQPQRKRSFDEAASSPAVKQESDNFENIMEDQPAKKTKTNAFQKAAPLAERMRPRSLDECIGQELVGPQGVLRSLIEQDRVPSMILWGGAGTGKTTIARCIASMVGSRFVEINSTSSGVADCKKIFAEARGELGLTGRKTILFCDEIHRFTKAQQDCFLGPVENGQVTLIGATTENPSFKVQNALLSRCRTFTLQKLTDDDIFHILERALKAEGTDIPQNLVDSEFLKYLAAFSDGDARTALNLLELAMSLSTRPSITKEDIKSSLTKTLVYDRAGDQHYDTISAFHKSVRGSDPDAALYYLARMLQSGEDPLYVARRMVVIASEDVGLADNSMLSLATGAYTAAEKIGMPECRIALAHATVALCLAPKSTRAYRGLNNAYAALREPGVASLPIPIHLRNAPTKLMKELGYGDQYKYNPNYKEGKVVQEYLPDQLQGRRFLEDRDLGTEIDPGVWQ